MTHEIDNSEAIAIVGMAGHFPAAANVNELWSLLWNGRSAVWAPSDEELRRLGVSEELLSHPNYVRARMRFEGADLFDAGFFGYSSKHAQMLDPQQRVFLECAWEALENAGYDAAACNGVTGVFASCGTNLYLLHRALLKFYNVGSWRKDDWGDLLLDADKDHIATRVSYKLGLTGPSIGVQTTCSSSLVAVHMACESLRRGECDLALAGGVSLIAAQLLEGYIYVKDGMNSPDGLCHAFDANAAGTAWGSGVGIVALKRYEDAVRDCDSIRAVIESTAINNDGSAKMGYNAPSVRGQQEVVALAQSLAGVTPDDIDLIEAHGTGTSLGDSIELASLIELFSAGPARSGEPCVLGSIKSNIGHLDVAAGVTGLIKAALCVEHRAFVPSLNFSKPNPALCQPQCPLFVNTEHRSWPARSGRPRRAGVSSLGFGGTNAHAILREAPDMLTADRPAGIELFPLSARTPSALASMCHRLAEHLRGRSELDLGNVAFTLQAGRRRFRHRRTIVADCRDRLLAALDQPGAGDSLEAVSDRTDCASVLAFSDGPLATDDAVASLYQSESNFRSDIDDCVLACRAHLSFDPGPFFSSGSSAIADAATDSVVQHAARFAVEYATARLWLRRGVAPAFVAGHGRGRITAQCVAGKITLHEAMLALQSTQVTPAEDVGVFRMDSLEGKPQKSAWEDLVRDTDNILLQVGPGSEWVHRLKGLTSQEHLPVLLPAFVQGKSEPRLQFLRTLANLWMQGGRIDWQRWHEGEQRMRVPLPTYPFERASHWLPVPEAPRESSSSPVVASAALSQQRFFVPTWRVANAGFSKATFPEPGECWLILADDDVGEQLARRLESEGAAPVVVVAGTEFHKLAEFKFAIAPDSAADYVRLFQELRARNLYPRRVVHCWSLANPDVVPSSYETFSQQQTVGYFSLLSFAKTLAAQGHAGECSLLVVTRRAYSLGGDDACQLANATLPGICKVMAQELSDLNCTLLDLGSKENGDVAKPESARQDVTRILAEAVLHPGEPVVVYRDSLRLVQELHEQEISAEMSMVRDLRERGVYVITGGLGKIGLGLARRLAETCHARLVLLTRNPFPSREMWPLVCKEPGAGTVAAKIRALSDIEALGAEVAVYAADVLNEEQVECAFADAESRFGPIAGVFHLAADMAHPSVDRPLTELTRQDVEAQFGPKIGGFYTLARVLASRRPDFGVLFSSNSSILGGFGFGAYAAANSFLDQCAGATLNKHFQWLCTNWDRWTDDARPATGADAEGYTIGTEAGFDALWTIMMRATTPQVIVAGASLRERRERWVVRRQKMVKASSVPLSSPIRNGMAPRTDLERTLAGIWQEVLGCEGIGVEDNFLDLGGDSLIALRILARLRELFQVEISLKALLGSRSTVASLVLELVTELQRTQPAPAFSGRVDAVPR